MVYGERDLRVFFGMGVPVAFDGVGVFRDGQPVKGLLDRGMQTKLGDQGFGGVDVATLELHLPLNAFDPMPDTEDEITVDGQQYRISDRSMEDDGAFVCYGLVRA